VQTRTVDVHMSKLRKKVSRHMRALTTNYWG
jgi:DNA-binding response OmpR family regulator